MFQESKDAYIAPPGQLVCHQDLAIIQGFHIIFLTSGTQRSRGVIASDVTDGVR